MVSTCCVPGCCTLHVEDGKTKFYRFPNSPLRKKKWIEALYNEGFEPSDTSVVCGNHFTQLDYIVNDHGTEVLSGNAIPSLFVKTENSFAEKQENAKDSNGNIATTAKSRENMSPNNIKPIFPKPPCDIDNVLDKTQIVRKITKDNFLEICRCCVVNNGEVDVFEAKFQNISIADLIYFCTNQRVLSFDELPSSVCKVCKQQIINSFLFINKVRDNEIHIRKLQKIFSLKHQEVSNDTSISDNQINSTTKTVEEVSSNSGSEIIPAREENFKEKYKGLTRVYKQLCDILLKNRSVVKKRVKTKQKKQTFLVEEGVINEKAEDQKMISWGPDVCVEEKICSGSSDEVKLILTENITMEDLLSLENCKVEQVAENSNSGSLENVDADEAVSLIRFEKMSYPDEKISIVPLDKVELIYTENISMEDLSSLSNCKIEQVAENGKNGSPENVDADEAVGLIHFEKINSPNDNEMKLTESEYYKKTMDNDLLNCEIYTVDENELNSNVEEVVHSSYIKEKSNGHLSKEEYINNEAGEHVNNEEGEHKGDKKAIFRSQCFECLEMFESEAGIIRHCRLTGHVMTDRFKCKLCSSTFRLRKIYLMHLQRHNRTKCICEVCGVGVYSNNLKRHLAVHTQFRNFVCQYCGKSYAQKIALDDHINHEHFGLGHQYLCFMCGKTFKTSKKLNDHLNSEHVDDGLANKTYQCEICLRFFICKVSLSYHQKYSHAKNRIKRPTYEKARKKNSGDENSTELKRSTFYKKKKLKQCTICSKYLNPDGYKNHMLIHQGIKPFECKICFKRFRQGCHLKAHIDVHLDRRPYKCAYCQKCFRRSIDLISHERLHTGERPFVCPICGKGCLNSTALKKHHKLHFEPIRDTRYQQQSEIVSFSNNQSNEKKSEAESSDSDSIQEKN